jgi:hypothetical protein
MGEQEQVGNGTVVRVVTAPEPWVNPAVDEVPVFLAGGITACEEWQPKVVDLVRAIPNLGGIIVYNPRRADFPIGDPGAARAQIEWEFLMLERAHVFSMWFSASPTSDQPICMYELGRHVALREDRRQAHLLAIGVEPGYRRAQDVEIQVGLAMGEAGGGLCLAATLEEHARNIGLAVLGARKLAQDLREKVRRAQEMRRRMQELMAGEDDTGAAVAPV